MKPFNGSIQTITTKASDVENPDKPAWDEGWSTAMSHDKKHILLQICDRHGDVARISLTPNQASSLCSRLMSDIIELDKKQK